MTRALAPAGTTVDNWAAATTAFTCSPRMTTAWSVSTRPEAGSMRRAALTTSQGSAFSSAASGWGAAETAETKARARKEREGRKRILPHCGPATGQTKLKSAAGWPPAEMRLARGNHGGNLGV